ncbi:Vacuolar morphogenesis protein 6, partial [Ascosphaera pollenicola]
MLSAFTARPLVELKPRDKSRIESLLSYGDRLLVGLNTGSLRVYRINEVDAEAAADAAEQPGTGNSDNEHHDEEDNKSTSAGVGGGGNKKTTPSSPMKTAELLQEHEKFSRYKIEQLAIIKEANLLVSLSGGYVSLHDMHSHDLQAQLTRTKGANTFAVASNIEKDKITGIPSIVSRLAIAVKRKLMLWTWIDSELVEDDEPGAGAAIREVTLPSGIKSLTWSTGNKLVAGLSSGYVSIDVETLDFHVISGPGSIGNGGQETSRYGMGYIGMGSGPKPLATYLGEGEMLLAKDVNSHFIDAAGHSLGRKQIPWTSPPEAVGYSYPYLLSLQDPYKGILEVRNPQTLSLLQSISLPSATILHIPQPYISLAHAGKGFLVASDRVIWRMAALDYDSQIDSLVEEGHLDEAISLLNMLEDALLTDKPGRLRQTKLRKAKRLFEQRKYRDAMDIFTEVSAPPEILIRLFPKSIAGPISTFVEEPEEEEEHSSSGNDEHGSHSPPASIIDKNKTNVAAGYAPSVRSFLLGRSSEDVPGTASTKSRRPPKSMERALVGKDLEAAVRELRSFLADIRRRIQRYIDDNGEPETAALKQGLIECDAFATSVMQLLGGTAEENETELAEKLLDTARLVDTTLFRAYMFTNPRLAGSLFRISNCCDPDVVMEKLEETNRYNDLIDFLYGKKLHKRALEELRKFGQLGEKLAVNEESTKRSDEGPSSQTTKTEDKSKHLDEHGEAIIHELRIEDIPPELIGPKRTVAYLQHLPPSMIDLILEYAEWPVRSDPGLGMEIFLADSENAELLPRHRVLAFLLNIDKKLAVRYLEHIIGELGDLDTKLHEKLLSLYLERLQELAQSRTKETEGKGGVKKVTKATTSEDELDDETAVQESEAAPEDDEYTATQSKFLVFLDESSQYSPAKMLDRLPRADPDSYEAQAILFSKMGQHKLALETYVFKLEDPVKAEQYCNKIHTATLAAERDADLAAAAAITAVTSNGLGRSSSGTSSPMSPSFSSMSPRGRPWDKGDPSEEPLSIYHILLGLYLSPPHNHPPQYSHALEILARHGSRLTAESAMKLIPESFPIRNLEFFFRRRMRASTSVLNRSKIEKGLRSVQNMALTRELCVGDDGSLGGPMSILSEKSLGRNNPGRSRNVVVSEERLCGVCLKRLGSSVISVFPDNSVVHLGFPARTGWRKSCGAPPHTAYRYKVHTTHDGRRQQDQRTTEGVDDSSNSGVRTSQNISPPSGCPTDISEDAEPTAIMKPDRERAAVCRASSFIELHPHRKGNDAGDDADARPHDASTVAERPSLQSDRVQTNHHHRSQYLFMDIFVAQRSRNRATDAAQYLQHTQNMMRHRDQINNQYLRQGPLMPSHMNMRLRSGMLPPNLQKAAMQNNANITPQHLAAFQKNQVQQLMQQQHQMNRDQPDIETPGRRPPPSPSAGDASQSPSKRPRLDNQQMTPGPTAVPGQPQGPRQQGGPRPGNMLPPGMYPGNMTPAQIHHIQQMRNAHFQQQSIAAMHARQQNANMVGGVGNGKGHAAMGNPPMANGGMIDPNAVVPGAGGPLANQGELMPGMPDGQGHNPNQGPMMPGNELYAGNPAAGPGQMGQMRQGGPDGAPVNMGIPAGPGAPGAMGNGQMPDGTQSGPASGNLGVPGAPGGPGGQTPGGAGNGNG